MKYLVVTPKSTALLDTMPCFLFMKESRDGKMAKNIFSTKPARHMDIFSMPKSKFPGCITRKVRLPAK